MWEGGGLLNTNHCIIAKAKKRIHNCIKLLPQITLKRLISRATHVIQRSPS